MKKKIFVFLLISVLFIAVFPVTASADVGPKPSVTVDFEGLSGQKYFVTLLSDVYSAGPYSVVTDAGNYDYQEGDADYPIYMKFVNYRDPDGYYFLQNFEDCSDTHQFSWTYRPPSNFKILLYFPDIDRFAVSAEAYDIYFLHSYFNVKLTDAEISSLVSQDEVFTFNAVSGFDVVLEIVGLISRILLTIVIEILIALLFVFRRKKQILLILAANVVTQIALNLALYQVHTGYGQRLFVISYILLELLVFAIEAVLYTFYLRKFSDRPIPKWKPIIYALVANAASFVLGLGISYLIPGIF